MDDFVLTRGRFKNKSYKEVLKNHPDYCKSIREAADKGEFFPADEDFATYLQSEHRKGNALTKVCEQGSSHFVKAMTEEMRSEFRELVQNIRIDEGRRVHPVCELGQTNGFLGVFYRYFIKKCVFNIRDEDGYNSYIEQCATVFPFEVTLEKINPDKMQILKTLYADEKFRSRTQSFLNAHFEDVQFDDVVDLFLSNIYRFQVEHNMDIRHLESVLKNESAASRFIDGSGDRFGNFRQGKPHPYLKTFPRLNKAGAKRFQNMYECYTEIARYQEDRPVEYSYPLSYFTNLPETNFYELFTLLESRFFEEDFDKYTERFHKYLFFFVGASKSVLKPVFFVDDILFECMKSLHKFKKSRLPATKIIQELMMITLVHRRKQACDKSHGFYEIDPAHLEHVKNYIENFRGIETAKIEFEIPNPDILQCSALLCLDDTTVDVRFSKLRIGAKTEFWESFLMAALCDSPVIKRLVLYNAYCGIEYSVQLDETFDRDGIRMFVRKYNSWDFSTKIPFEKSLTWGWEENFVDGTIDWENKNKKTPMIVRK